jgi:AraC-like DNA-binding protein
VSDILFPAGLTVDLPELNVEMMQYYAKMWDVEHTQLGKGVFEGSLFGVHTPRIQMGTSHFSHAIMTQGSFPEGCIVLYYPGGLPNTPAYNFHNRTIAANEIAVLTKGDALDLLTHDAIALHTMVIEEELFCKTFYTFFGVTPATHIKNKRLHLKTDKIAHFHQMHTDWISYLAEEFPKMSNKPAYESIESEILHQFFSCIHLSGTTKKRNKFQIKTVRDLLHANIDKNVDIHDISDGLDISASQLHQVFKKEYGVTPKRYLQLLRFTAIRKELLHGGTEATTINKIATKYHFYQMGHFSAAYKQLFGEIPSQTLQKNH